jgi:LmbE family N-acetylglucosaminyl deacetylase
VPAPGHHRPQPKVELVTTFGVICPHPDDATLSCSLLLGANPGAHIVTVFDGGPTCVDPVPSWEEHSGQFHAGDDITAIRRSEDEAAARLLGATSHHLMYWDDQYRSALYGYRGPENEELASAIALDLSEVCGALPVSRWVIPLGISHVDHRATAAACLKLAHSGLEAEWWIYEDLPYWREGAEPRRAAKDRLHAAGFELSPISTDVGTDLHALKHKAIHCHRSQIAALRPGRVRKALEGPELYHRLVDAS